MQNRLVHPGAGQIPDTPLVFGGIAPLTGQGQVHVQQAQCPKEGTKTDFLMNPVVFLVPVGGEARLLQDFGIFRLALVSGENHGGQVIALGFGDGLRRRHILGELGWGLSRFPAVIVTEGVASDFLTRSPGDHLQQRRGKKAGSIHLVLPYPGKVFIGGNFRILIGGLFGGAKGFQFRFVIRKQKAHGRPGGMNAVLLKKRQKLGDGLPASEHMGLVFFQGAHVQHTPEQLKIQRYDQRSRHVSVPPPQSKFSSSDCGRFPRQKAPPVPGPPCPGAFGTPARHTGAKAPGSGLPGCSRRTGRKRRPR